MERKIAIRKSTKAQFRRRTSRVPYPNTISLQGRIKRLTLRYPEILPCLVEFCPKKLI